MLPKEEQHLIDLATRRLAEKYPEKSFADVSDAISRAHAHFVGSRIRDYLPLLVERHADRELGADARIA